MKKDELFKVVIIAFLLFKTIIITGQNPSSKKNKYQINNYLEKEITPYTSPIDQNSSIIYFEDSIKGINCKLYLISDINKILVHTSLKYAKDWKLKAKLKKENAILIINDSFVRLKKIEDSKILLPMYIDHFIYNDSKFILIKLNLISYMSGNYWYNLLLKFNINDQVIDQYGYGSTENIAKKKLFLLLKNYYKGY